MVFNAKDRTDLNLDGPNYIQLSMDISNHFDLCPRLLHNAYSKFANNNQRRKVLQKII